MKYILSALFTVSVLVAFGQGGSENYFYQLLDSAQVYFAEPLESFKKPTRIIENELLDYQYAWQSRVDPVEIRYHIDPIGESDPSASAPHVLINAMTMNLADNDEEDANMVFHRLPDDVLEPFKADLGVVVFFKPKSEFSNKNHCKAIYYYAYGRGLIATFLLFDKTTIDLSIYDDALSFN